MRLFARLFAPPLTRLDPVTQLEHQTRPRFLTDNLRPPGAENIEISPTFADRVKQTNETKDIGERVRVQINQNNRVAEGARGG